MQFITSAPIALQKLMNSVDINIYCELNLILSIIGIEYIFVHLKCKCAQAHLHFNTQHPLHYYIMHNAFFIRNILRGSHLQRIVGSKSRQTERIWQITIITFEFNLGKVTPACRSHNIWFSLFNRTYNEVMLKKSFQCSINTLVTIVFKHYVIHNRYQIVFFYGIKLNVIWWCLFDSYAVLIIIEHEILSYYFLEMYVPFKTLDAFCHALQLYLSLANGCLLISPQAHFPFWSAVGIRGDQTKHWDTNQAKHHLSAQHPPSVLLFGPEWNKGYCDAQSGQSLYNSLGKFSFPLMNVIYCLEA